MTLKNNKEIRAYTLKVQESIALRPSALTIDKTLIYYGYDQNNIAENGYPLNVFGLEQNFNFPTVYTSQSKANSVQITMAELELARQKLLTKDVSQAYYEILYLLNKQKVYAKIDSLYRGFERGATFQYNHGEISQLELLNAKARKQQIAAANFELKHNLVIAYRNLQTLMLYDSAFEIQFQPLSLIDIHEINLESCPGNQLMKMKTAHELALLQVERNKMFPDLSLNYFIGNNSYEYGKKYQGFTVGLSLPLFFGEQQAKINAGKISITIRENLQENDLSLLKAKHAVLLSQLMKYKELIETYDQTGQQLSEEIIRTSQRSYALGELDFFQFVMSLENAFSLTIAYYENIAKYNQFALELNYLTN
jgi:cobalt-zinc-cadmium resistance protein CzcA